MRIALASPSMASTLDEGLDKIKLFMAEASTRDAKIICFPEAYLPGLRGQDFQVLPFEAAQQARVLNVVGGLARAYAIVTVLGTERITEAGRQVAAFVFGTSGQILGYQTKNQLAPAEDQFYVPGRAHQIYEANGV